MTATAHGGTGPAAVASAIPVEVLLAAAAAGARPEQPQALFDAVSALVREVVGYRLFSISAFVPATRELVRLYSSDDAAYPVGGRKIKRGTPWAASVLDAGEAFLGSTRDRIRDAFDDHDLIFALGLGSVINVPVRWAGTTLGTMNLLDREGRYGNDHLRAAVAAGQLLVPGFLARTRATE